MPLDDVDLDSYPSDVLSRVMPLTGGTVADYIPALAQADPERCGLAIATVAGAVHEAGDARHAFSIQSVSKPFTYALALAELGLEVVDEVIDVEPSGEAYNEISLQKGTGRPANALINAGAICATSLLPRRGRGSRLIDFYSGMAGRQLRADAQIAIQEHDAGYRNLALAHLMKGFDVLGDDPDASVRDYSLACATMVTTADLAVMAATLANGGIHPQTGEELISSEIVQRVLSVMVMCGMYDDAGVWMVRVGLPGKSGVGGGVIAVAPGRLGLAAYSPRLDRHGSSVRGIKLCELMSADLDLHLMRRRG